MRKKILLGVTSGIAAYKSLELIKLLKAEDIDVSVILTKHAAQMVPIKEFEHASNGKVYTQLFEDGFDYKDVLKNRSVDHIDLADSADLMAIVPATANIIAKIAHGFAEDFLTTTTLAVTAPIVLAPSMNVHMWQNPIVQANLQKLKQLGYSIIEPAEGMLACGYEGKGRLEDIQVIKDELVRLLRRTDTLTGKRVIVTAGGTIEKIDEVRNISNKSSGKMGVAIAEECYLRGANVVLIRANNSITPRYRMTEKTFDTADELYELIKEELPTGDFIFHTAAVSDFQVEQTVKGKIPSEMSATLRLEPRIKIADQIKKLNPAISLILFKAEFGLNTADLTKEAIIKLRNTKADAVVANDVSQKDRGFHADTNEVILVTKDEKHHMIPLASKKEIATKIVDHVLAINAAKK